MQAGAMVSVRKFNGEFQVRATADLAVQRQLELAANNLALSPDGKWLLLTSVYDMTGANGQLERVTNGLYMVDTQTLQVTAHIEKS